jgi:hypothetical protein
MNFDFGEVLSRAVQITWKHKALWLFGALPGLLGFLIFPLMFLPLIFLDFVSNGEPSVVEPLLLLVIIGVVLFLSLLSFILYGISSASLTLGTLQVEDGAQSLTIRNLFIDGKKYWLRVLGVWLLYILGIIAVFFVIFGCLSLFGVVTMGLGFLCIQPFILLLYPLMMIIYGAIEESLAAVIADNLDVLAAIQRGWELLKTHFWRIFLISFIVYFAAGLLSMLAIMPFMIPFFFAPFFLDGTPASDMRLFLLIIGGISLLMTPIMALVQGVIITFQKAAYALTYLRLTRPKADAAPASETNA